MAIPKNFANLIDSYLSKYVGEEYPLYRLLISNFFHFVNANVHKKIFNITDNTNIYSVYDELLNDFFNQYFKTIDTSLYQITNKDQKKQLIRFAKSINNSKGLKNLFSFIFSYLKDFKIVYKDVITNTVTETQIGTIDWTLIEFIDLTLDDPSGAVLGQYIAISEDEDTTKGVGKIVNITGNKIRIELHDIERYIMYVNDASAYMSGAKDFSSEDGSTGRIQWKVDPSGSETYTKFGFEIYSGTFIKGSNIDFGSLIYSTPDAIITRPVQTNIKISKFDIGDAVDFDTKIFNSKNTNILNITPVPFQYEMTFNISSYILLDLLEFLNPAGFKLTIREIFKISNKNGVINMITAGMKHDNRIKQFQDIGYEFNFGIPNGDDFWYAVNSPPVWDYYPINDIPDSIYTGSLAKLFTLNVPDSSVFELGETLYSENPIILLRVIDDSQFNISNYITGNPQVSNNNGVGIIVDKDATYLYVKLISGYFSINGEVDNENPFVSVETTLTHDPILYGPIAIVTDITDIITIKISAKYMDYGGFESGQKLYNIPPLLDPPPPNLSVIHKREISELGVVSVRDSSKIILELADTSNFTVGGDITGDSINFNTGVGIIDSIDGNTVIVSIISGQFIVGQAVDNVNPHTGAETTIDGVKTIQKEEDVKIIKCIPSRDTHELYSEQHKGQLTMESLSNLNFLKGDFITHSKTYLENYWDGKINKPGNFGIEPSIWNISPYSNYQINKTKLTYQIGMDSNEETYVDWDIGPGFEELDYFELDYELTVTECHANCTNIITFGIAEDVMGIGGMSQVVSTAGAWQGIALIFDYVSPTSISLKLIDNDGISTLNSNTVYASLNIDTKYYISIRIDWTLGSYGAVAVSIYSDSDRKILLGYYILTLGFDLRYLDVANYEKIYGFYLGCNWLNTAYGTIDSEGENDARTTKGVVEDTDLNLEKWIRTTKGMTGETYNVYIAEFELDNIIWAPHSYFLTSGITRG